ncbi:MAG TPA: metallophosphoesterase [Thermoplasmata archaeon]|nr:metallophosphoesterase [Thermoplasmata archaeon]
MDPRNFRFAHLADAHVGAWSRDPAVRQALRTSVLAALELVERREAEFLLISGDLFHTPIPDPGEVAPVAAALRRLTEGGRRIYVIYGSHDYVAHRVSWLDVLAETGIFLRAAPDPVRAEGERWTLPFTVDAPTQARIAGISGRAHGLDRGAFASVDSGAFRTEPGFKIFQFHAAIDEFLPAPFRGHIRGIPVTSLPAGCDYYAGGHIHFSYSATLPGGGLLVNPGAVFGTSIKDLEYAAEGRTHQGVVIVEVRDGRPTAEFVDTTPRGLVRVFDINVEGRSTGDARTVVQEEVAAHAAPGALLFPRIHGSLSEGSTASLGLRTSHADAAARGAAAVHWDLQDTTSAKGTSGEAAGSSEPVDEEVFLELGRSADPILAELAGEDGVRRMRELLRELGLVRVEGESAADYRAARLDGGLRALGVARRTGREARVDDAT